MKPHKRLRKTSDKFAELEELAEQLLDAIKNEDLEEALEIKDQVSEALDSLTELIDEDADSLEVDDE